MQHRSIPLIAVAALAFAAAPAAAQQGAAPMGQAPHTRDVTITGDVIDLSCRLGQGLGGESHKMCAGVCADRGIPLAILGSDGKVYLPISPAMPGDAQNARLKAFADHRARATGRPVELSPARNT